MVRVLSVRVKFEVMLVSTATLFADTQSIRFSLFITPVTRIGVLRHFQGTITKDEN